MDSEDAPAEMAEARDSSKLPLPHQEKFLAELHETISQLENRLKPVLTPMLKDGESVKADSADKAVASPIANKLHDHNGRIRSATNKLHGLMSRLEV